MNIINPSQSSDELFQAVALWGRDKGLNDPVMQFAKVNEEIGELAHELVRGRIGSSEMEDAFGDILVTLIILADILNYDLLSCLAEAYNTIKDRKGKTVNGSFIKENE